MATTVLPCPVALSGAAQRVSVPFTAAKLPNTTTRLVLANVAAVKTAIYQVQSTAVSGSSPTLDCKLQHSLDGGTTWVDVASGAAAQITAASQVKTPVSSAAAHGDQLALLLTVGGTAQASTLTDGTGTASLAFTSVATDGTGDAVTVTIAQGAGALSVAVVGNDITITLAAAGSTATQVKTAYDLVGAATALAAVAVSGGGGTVLVAPKTNLSGGAVFVTGQLDIALQY